MNIGHGDYDDDNGRAMSMRILKHVSSFTFCFARDCALCSMLVMNDSC